MQASNIDEVIVLLDGIIADQRETRSPLAFFAALYRAVTVRVRSGLGTGMFADDERMQRFDTAFANRYLAAFHGWRTTQSTPRAWQVAFGNVRRDGVMILQHLLLGMNAHINFDLPVVAQEVAPGASLPELEHDFLAINKILGSLLDPVQAAIDAFSPLLDVLDRVGGRNDEAIITFSLTNAREEAWHEALRLAGEDDARRERSIKSLDRRVALLAERIIVPGGPCGCAIELISRTENADVHAVTDALLRIR